MKKYLIIFILSSRYFSANAQVTLNLNLFIEGYYNSNSGKMDNYGAGGCLFVNNISTDSADADTVIVSLVNPVSAVVKAGIKGILKTDGTVTVNFDSSIVAGQAYYIRIQHRSAVETWSAAAVTLSSVTNYDFSIASSQAFGNNMTNVGTVSQPVWALYSGDIADAGTASVCVIQDGIIEGQDYSEMEDAEFISLTGYVCQDITGNGVVDTLDYLLEQKNVWDVIFSIRPYIAGINEINKRNNNNRVIKCFSDGDNLRFADQPEIYGPGVMTVYSSDGKRVYERHFANVYNINTLTSGLKFSSGVYVIHITTK